MPGIDLVPAWRRDDPKVIADAIALWRRLGALPDGVDVDARARELCAAAYAGDELAGIATAAIGPLPALPGCRFAFFRCLTAPAYRRLGIARSLAVFSRDELERWSAADPQERLHGMAAVVEGRNLAELGRLPVWQHSGLTLIGHTRDGRQIRLCWFRHARLD